MIEDKNQVNREDFAGIAQEDKNFAEKYVVNKTGTLIEKKDVPTDNKFYADSKEQIQLKERITNPDSNYSPFYSKIKQTIEKSKNDPLNTSKNSVYSQNTQGTMIIHPDETEEEQPKEEPNEEAINDTGTMIIKTVESEFQKSDNWNVILAKEKKAKYVAKNNPKGFKMSTGSVKSQEKLASPQEISIKLKQEQIASLIQKIPFDFRNMTIEQTRKETKLLNNEMQREIKAIEKKFKSRIIFLMKIQEKLSKIRVKQSEIKDLQNVKFQGFNQPKKRPFYLQEEHPKKKSLFQSKKKLSKLSNISIASKQDSISNVQQCLENQKRKKSKYLRQWDPNIGKKNKNRNRFEKSIERSLEKRKKKKVLKLGNRGRGKPESLLLFEQLRKRSGAKKAKESIGSRQKLQSRSPFKKYKQRNKENLNKLCLSRKSRKKGSTRELRISKNSYKSRDSTNSQNIVYVRDFQEDNSYLYGQNSQMNGGYYKNRNKTKKIHKKRQVESNSFLNEKEGSILGKIMRKISRDNINNNESFSQKVKKRDSHHKGFPRKSKKTSFHSKNILNISQINNSKRFRDYFLNH